MGQRKFPVFVLFRSSYACFFFNVKYTVSYVKISTIPLLGTQCWQICTLNLMNDFFRSCRNRIFHHNTCVCCYKAQHFSKMFPMGINRIRLTLLQAHLCTGQNPYECSMSEYNARFRVIISLQGGYWFSFSLKRRQIFENSCFH